MPFVGALVVALATLAVSSPIEQLAQQGRFSVQQVAGRPKPALPILTQRTYAKFGGVLPTDLQAAADAAQAAADAGGDTGSVAAKPEPNDIEYLCETTVGGTNLTLNLDTGSADFWVYSTLMPKSQIQGQHSYDPTKAGGKIITDHTWKISYGDGSAASGTVYADKVTIGGVTATSQAIEAATSVSSSFTRDTHTDGLVGLAFSKINTVKPNKQLTFFDSIKDQLKAPLFTVTLKKGAAGSYDFGYIDEKKYTGNITYTPADSARGYWGLKVEGYKVGSDAAVGGQSVSAIVDTGTTLLYLPDDIVKAYYDRVPTANSRGGSYSFPCSTKLPDFGLIIGGKPQVIPGSHINYAPNSRGSTSCSGGIQSNSGLGLSILGDIFLKSQFVVHDVSGAAPRLGFAPQVGVS